jgi:hypothetical protein
MTPSRDHRILGGLGVGHHRRDGPELSVEFTLGREVAVPLDENAGRSGPGAQLAQELEDLRRDGVAVGVAVQPVLPFDAARDMDVSEVVEG